MLAKGVVLVALGKHVSESDVDFLVIASKKEIPPLGNVNIVVMNRREFERKFMKVMKVMISSSPPSPAEELFTTRNTS